MRIYVKILEKRRIERGTRPMVIPIARYAYHHSLFAFFHLSATSIRKLFSHYIIIFT